MKHILYPIIILLLITITGRGQNNVGINDNNSSPNASAMLDVYSTSKGILIPRVALTSTASASPITSPATSLLIYNTATTSDVTVGYYYWNGTKWVRLTAGTDPVKNGNFVSKSTTSTLLKTENLVFASGNITLKLPTVTSTDDGLEICVKNVGTYTDFIKVTAQAGKKIDAMDSSYLTRWRSKTFVATGTNWVERDKPACSDNLLDVSPMGSFTTIGEAVAFLNLHMMGPTVLRLDGGEYTETSSITINLPHPLTIQGISYGESTIIAGAGVTGSTIFNCTSECYFKMLIFQAASNAVGNDAIHLNGTSGTYHEIKDCVFTGFNKAVVATNAVDLWLFESDFEDCLAAGVELAGGSNSGGTFRISESDFFQCGKGIRLLSGLSWTISILNGTFYNTASGTDIGIEYTPATFLSTLSMLISNNSWNTQGTFITGFDFSRSDSRDANVHMLNNAGMASQNPHCKINVSNNTSTTTITTANTYYKAAWTNAATSSTCKWTLANNRATYQPNNGSDVWAIITGDLSVAASNRVITIGIVKNGVSGTRYGETDLRVTTSNQPFQFSTVVYIPGVNKNDYLELWVTSTTSLDVVKFQDVQWFINTQ